MITACIVIIGNEILSGRTQDANLAFISKELNELGVQVTEARVIPDIEATIIDTVNTVRKQFDYVITTGGIGPTHDDITADCIAKAFAVELPIHPEAEAIIRRRPAPEDIMRNRLRMARIPQGAELVANEYGPPGFKIENVIVLAGIPLVVQSMIKDLPNKIIGDKPVRSITVGAYLGESQIAEQLERIQQQYSGVDLGSYPFYKNERFGTNLVMRSSNADDMATMAGLVRELISSHGESPVDDGV